MNDLRAAVLPRKFAFIERKQAFLKLALRGMLLELLTFGFYRFWMTTDIRRHLWSHTAIDGDALEYTGTGRELLFGFLFAVAILGPFYFLYFLLGVEAERQQSFASAPLVVLFYLFAQFANFRARRYRLTRTVWRGVRFSMRGWGLSYVWRAALWELAVIVTLGLAYPWRAAALERIKMRATSYGDLAGDFVGTGAQFFGRAGGMWMTSFILVAANVMAFALASPRFGSWYLAKSLLPILLFVSVIALPLIFAAFKAEEWRWWAQGLRLGETRLSSNLTTPSYIGLLAKFFGVAVFVGFAGLLGVGIIVVLTIYNAAPPGADSKAMALAFKSISLAQLAPIIAGYLATLFCFGLVQRYFLQFRLWGLIVASLQAHRLATAEARRVEIPSALGEGLADGLDFGF